MKSTLSSEAVRMTSATTQSHCAKSTSRETMFTTDPGTPMAMCWKNCITAASGEPKR
jgi:hypothetical protein